MLTVLGRPLNRPLGLCIPVACVIRRAAWTAAMVAIAILLLAASLAQTRPPETLLPDAPRLLQTASQRYGANGTKQVQAWLDMLARSRKLTEAAQIQAVNDFWNQAVAGAEDIDVWNQTDYWATPLESLGRGRGDCEDYVIGKYFSLVALGVPANKLRFVYVKATMGGAGSGAQVAPIQVAHMVLGYYATPNAVPLVLDNLYTGIEPASNRRDLSPVFSFNASGVYVQGKQASPVERIGRWNDLLLRMQSEGFN